jgi:hypothetical protein
MLFTSLCHLNPSSRAREHPRSLPFAGLRHACQPAFSRIRFERGLLAHPCPWCSVLCRAAVTSRIMPRSLSFDKSTRPRSLTWTYFAAGEPFAHEPIWYWQLVVSTYYCPTDCVPTGIQKPKNCRETPANHGALRSCAWSHAASDEVRPLILGLLTADNCERWLACSLPGWQRCH